VAARRMTRARARTKNHFSWTATETILLNVIPGDMLDFPVVDPIIDLDNPTAHVECTLLRMRGYLHVIPNGIVANEDWSCMIAAYVLDEDESVTTVPPSAVSTYTHEDILWTDGAGGFLPSAVPIDFAHGHHFTVDIKAKRKLAAGQVAHVVVENTGGIDIAVMGVIRGLITV